MKKINRDICEGPIFKSLIRYIIPLMLTNLIQVFYISADNIIAGVFCGSAALAAVGSASTIISFLTTLIIGLSTGASVCVVCVAVTGLLFGITTLVFGKELLSLYITDSADALNYGLLTFSLLSLPSLISGVGNCLSGATRGMGVSLPQLFVSLGGAVGLKFLWIYTIFQTPKFHNPAGLLTADPIIWILQTTVVAVIFVVTFRKKVSQKTN